MMLHDCKCFIRIRGKWPPKFIERSWNVQFPRNNCYEEHKEHTEAASSRNTLSLKITTVWREVSQNHNGDTEDRKIEKKYMKEMKDSIQQGTY